MSKEDNIAKHRLGVARKALKKIIEYKCDEYEDLEDMHISLKHIAEQAMREIERIK